MTSRSARHWAAVDRGQYRGLVATEQHVDESPPPANDADATTVSITGLDQFGTAFTENFDIDNGEGFFSILATAGQVITGVSFTTGSDLGFTDIRQIRINTGTNLVADVPEPATWAMMLLGFGATGMAMRRSRRRKGALLTQIA